MAAVVIVSILPSQVQPGGESTTKVVGSAPGRSGIHYIVLCMVHLPLWQSPNVSLKELFDCIIEQRSIAWKKDFVNRLMDKIITILLILAKYQVNTMCTILLCLIKLLYFL